MIFLVPTVSNKTSNRQSPPIGVTFTMLPSPKVLWLTLSPAFRV